ncbi:MAG: hypothetical protein D6808_04515 [Candidatus Dadabacteria bacterium]|nr:MAG: hypothetical protein D6808_04515 [Candidatus Dadabacteria bacterium]
MKNLGLKIFSLAVAVALSYYVNSETNVSVIGFSVPVEIKNIPENKMLVWPLTPKAQITVKGPSYLVSQVATSNFTFKVELPDDVGYSYTVALRRSFLSLPSSVEVVAIEPSELELTFDKRVTKSVPVIVPRIGKLPSEVKLDRMSVNPPRVKLIGPESELKKIRTVETQPVDIRGITSTVEKKLKIRIPGTLTKVSNDEVAIKIEVSPVEMERKFRKVPIQIRPDGEYRFKIKPQRASVEVSGGSDVVPSLKQSDIRAYIDATTIGKNNKAKVLVDLPKDVELVIVEPEFVKIIREKQK